MQENLDQLTILRNSPDEDDQSRRVSQFAAVIGPCLPTVEEIRHAAMLDNNPLMVGAGGVTAISDMNIILAYAAKVKVDWMDLPYEEISGLVQEWCKTYKSSYYSDCKEDFFIFKAFEKAEKEGNLFVITENLS